MEDDDRQPRLEQLWSENIELVDKSMEEVFNESKQIVWQSEGFQPYRMSELWRKGGV